MRILCCPPNLKIMYVCVFINTINKRKFISICCIRKFLNTTTVYSIFYIIMMTYYLKNWSITRNIIDCNLILYHHDRYHDWWETTTTNFFVTFLYSMHNVHIFLFQIKFITMFCNKTLHPCILNPYNTSVNECNYFMRTNQIKFNFNINITIKIWWSWSSFRFAYFVEYTKCIIENFV